MRNIIFTSIAASLLAGAALGGELRPGCYHRDYTDAHLASHPDQIVDWISMIVEKDAQGYTVARMLVATANQGYVRATKQGGQLFKQWLGCWQDGARAFCAVDCDGGNFTVTRDTGTSITFQTTYLMVGETDDCGGAIDLAEIPGKPVKYRLDLVSDSACDGL